MTQRHRCDLNMASDGQQRFQAARDIAVQDLAMIDVELQPEIGQVQFIDQPFRQHEIIHQIAGNVAAIDRLDQDIDAVTRRRLAGELDRVLVGSHRCVSRGDAGHQVQARRAGGAGIIERGFNRGAEFIAPA